MIVESPPNAGPSHPRGILARLPHIDLTLPATGLFVGLLIGLTGIGGGAVMTPFLILVLGTRPVVAVGTDLVYGAVTKAAGAWLHWKQDTVDMRLSLRLAAASVPIVDETNDHHWSLA